ncbi:MAG: glycosyltransferase family protein, partial [Chloroflexota bacterium]
RGEPPPTRGHHARPLFQTLRSASVRIAIRPFAAETARQMQELFPEHGPDEIICLESSCLSYGDLLAQLPAGWVPDIFICYNIEYFAVPQLIEHAGCFTVGILGDWNLGGQAMQLVGGMFDLLVADRNGVDRLTQAGFDNVRYIPLWTFSPGFHRRLPNFERDLDIVMVGSFNHEVQRERARWLARVARLSRKHRVCLTRAQGEEYVRYYNRAKIVFNRSIRGEINQRAYEAPACGALLFYERENDEIRDLFVDRQECVLYGDGDLEELIDYYLTHDEERERVAEAGYRRVQTESATHNLARLLGVVKEAARQRGAGAGRRHHLLPPLERDIRRGTYLALSGCADSADGIFRQLLRPGSARQGEALCGLACAQATLALADAPVEMRRAYSTAAVEPAGRAVQLFPEHVAPLIDCAEIWLRLAGDLEAAKAHYYAATLLLRADGLAAEQLRGPYLRGAWRTFDVELERVWAYFRPETDEWTEEMRGLLLWHALASLSEIYYAQGRYDEAVWNAAEAVDLRPDLAIPRYRLARALRAAGEVAGATAEFRQAFQDMPMLEDLWTEFLDLLLESGQRDECRAFLETVTAIVDACPPFEHHRPHLRTVEAALGGG